MSSSSVYMKIDTRENELKKIFENKEKILVEALDLGDIVFEKDKGEKLLTIERKTINDLAASICDGRYREQKARMLGSGIERARIIYLIEGDILHTSVTIKGGNNNLVSCLINILLRDGIMIYKTADINETANFLDKMLTKLNNDGESFWNFENKSVMMPEYLASVKQKKKENVDSKTWLIRSLSSIPNVTVNMASKISETYVSMKDLLQAYSVLKSDDEKTILLANILYVSSSGKERKIGKALSAKIYNIIGQ